MRRLLVGLLLFASAVRAPASASSPGARGLLAPRASAVVAADQPQAPRRTFGLAKKWQGCWGRRGGHGKSAGDAWWTRPAPRRCRRGRRKVGGRRVANTAGAIAKGDVAGAASAIGEGVLDTADAAVDGVADTAPARLLRRSRHLECCPRPRRKNSQPSAQLWTISKTVLC